MKTETRIIGSGKAVCSGKSNKEGKIGIWECFDEATGKKVMVEEYLNDQKHGRHELFNLEGIKMVSAQFNRGEAEGEWKSYYGDSGAIKEEGFYRDGIYHNVSFYDRKGNPLLEDGTGFKIEQFGAGGIDIYLQHFEKGQFLREVKISEDRMNHILDGE